MSLDFDNGSATAKTRLLGFNYFRGDVQKAFLDPLQPKFWRTTVYGEASAQALFQSYGPSTTYVISEAYVQTHGGQGQAKPYANWPDYEAFVANLMGSVKASGIDVAYWDVWNEPEGNWPGTPAQFLELVARTVAVVRKTNPQAKVVATSQASVDTTGFANLLTALGQLADSGTHLDALSWHALDDVERIPTLANQARAFFVDHPNMCNPACPQLHVNEFSPGQNDHLPGWALAWLVALDRGHIDWAAKSCWQIPSLPPNLQSGCGFGLEGLFVVDDTGADAKQTRPRPTYWLYRAYAQLTTRAVIDVTEPGWVALGGAQSDGTISVLVGRHSCGAKNRWCTFADHNVEDDGLPAAKAVLTVHAVPWGNAQVTVSRLAHTMPETALLAPEIISKQVVTTSEGVATIPIDSVEDGEAMIIQLGP